MIRITLCALALIVPLRASAQQTDAAAPTRDTPLRLGPDGQMIGRLLPSARVEILARERDWVRLRVEGWARATDFAPAESALLGIRSAADLRADPVGTRGKLVRWDVETISLQTADPLRRGLADGEPYLLARGPGTESSLLYLAVPSYLLSAVRGLPPLARITVVARVRTGRSEPVGVPVLDIESLARRE